MTDPKYNTKPSSLQNSTMRLTMLLLLLPVGKKRSEIMRYRFVTDKKHISKIISAVFKRFDMKFRRTTSILFPEDFGGNRTSKKPISEHTQDVSAVFWCFNYQNKPEKMAKQRFLMPFLMKKSKKNGVSFHRICCHYSQNVWLTQFIKILSILNMNTNETTLNNLSKFSTKIHKHLIKIMKILNKSVEVR